jgi:hypothetical protein
MAQPTQTAERFTFQMPVRFALREAEELPTGIARIYNAIFFDPRDKPNGWTIPPKVLKDSAELWNAASMYANHPDLFSVPDIFDLVGVVRAAKFEAATGSMIGEAHMLALKQAEPTIELLDLMIKMKKAGDEPPPIGLSAILNFEWHFEEERGRVVDKIVKVWSVDVVFEGAAKGKATTIRHSIHGEMNMHTCTKCGKSYEEGHEHTCSAQHSAPPPAAPPAAAAPPAPAPAANAVAQDIQESILRASCQQLLDVQLAAANLPAPLAAYVRSQFTENGKTRIFHADELDKAITSAKETAAALAAPGAVQGNGNPAHPGRVASVTGMWSDLDQVQAAYDRMMGLSIAPELANVPRLTGIRELYHLITGDRELHGRFRPERVYFSNANTTTLAEMTRNVTNKTVAMVWSDMTDYRWWERVVSMQDFESLQQVSWITVGGFGDLSTVPEGAQYPEITWDDSRETSDWLKKGGYLGLTMEMIDRDDTQKWRVVPRGMAIAALRTLSATVGSIFTQASGAGPTLSDGLALFHASHANLRTVALGPAEWDAVVQAVYSQTEFHSGRRLAIRPSLVIVPIELRKTGNILFTSAQEPGGALNDRNIAGVDQNFQSDNVIVCPELTDANDWASMVDPRIAPAIGAGFRFGRTPEVFIASDPDAFLLFHNDVLPVKVRFFYNVGVIDFRPVHKSNVA